MGERSFLTDAAMETAELLRGMKDEFGKLGPPLGQERMTSKQFKAHYGIGIRDMQELQQTHGPDTMKSILDLLQGGM